MPIPDYIDNSRHKLQDVLQTLINAENQIILDIATAHIPHRGMGTPRRLNEPSH